jgi:hypothetical protein
MNRCALFGKVRGAGSHTAQHDLVVSTPAQSRTRGSGSATRQLRNEGRARASPQWSRFPGFNLQNICYTGPEALTRQCGTTTKAENKKQSRGILG